MKQLLVLLSFFALTACGAGQGFQPPSIDLPQFWQSLSGAKGNVKQAETDADPPPLDAWWKRFDDETLNVLMERAVENNRDLKIAAARVREARTTRIIADAAMYPTVNARAGASRGNDNNVFNDKAISVFDAKFDASWEIDLFGRVRNAADAAEATIASREADERGTLVSLRAEVARNYIELRNLQQQIDLTKSTAAAQKDTAKLTRSLMTAGLGTELDAARADAQSHATLSRIPALETERTKALSALAVLLGTTADKLPDALQVIAPVPVTAAEVVVEAPARVIALRPDVAASERALASAASLSKAAVAELYPSISLSGIFGIRNTSLAGGANGWSMGTGLVQPIFNAGRIRANISASDARADIALNTYEQTVLKAQGEVEAAIAAYLNAEMQRAALERSSQSSWRALSVAKERYRKGITPFIDVLTAERDNFAARSDLAEAEARVSKNLVALLKGLGA